MDLTNSKEWIASDYFNRGSFLSAFNPEQVSFVDDILVLSLEDKEFRGARYSSGEYVSVNSYHYGKYSVRLKASNIAGTVTSFFTYSDGDNPDEIDIEILGKDPTKLHINYFKDGIEHPVVIDLDFDASSDFHNYSFVWRKKNISWFVDNLLVYSIDGVNIPRKKSKIIINHWGCKNDWCGEFKGDQASKAFYEFIKFEKI